MGCLTMCSGMVALEVPREGEMPQTLVDMVDMKVNECSLGRQWGEDSKLGCCSECLRWRLTGS